MFKFAFRNMDLSHKYDEVPSASSDKEFQKHYHNFYEIFYFISGTAMYTVEKEKRVLHLGDALIIKPGEFHNVDFLDKTPYERYVLKLPVGFMPGHLTERLQGHSAFYPGRSDAIDLLKGLDRAAETYTGNDMYYFGGCIVSQLVIYLTNTRDTGEDEVNLANAKVVPVLQYINDNVDKQLTLANIADHFNYSPDYISREFYRYMKTPIMKYVRAKRILAARMLINNGFKPTQVSDMLGFSDYSTFYRSYVSVTGKSPTDDISEKSTTKFPDE